MTRARTCSRALAARIAAGALAFAALAAGAPAHAATEVMGQWRFDEPSGVAALDDGPFGLDGRFGAEGAGATDPQRVAGLRGGALRFDGGGFVRLPVASELAPPALTIEAVVRHDGSPGQFRYLVAHGAQGCIASSYGMYTGEAGGIAFYVFDGRRYVISPGAAPADVWDGAWHHIAGVFDGAALRLYVDGHPVGTPEPAPLTIAYALTSNDTYFGMYRGSCALALKGDVDLIRLWAGALGPGTLAALADEALAPAPAVDPPEEEVPTAPPAAADPPDAAPSRSPLAAATPGTTIPAAPGAGGGDGGAAAPKAAPGAPPRACVVRPSSTRVRARHVSVITVQVKLRSRPLHRVRVVATQASTKRVLASARTARDGRARLRLKPARRGTVRLQVSGRRDCGTAALRVLAS